MRSLDDVMAAAIAHDLPRVCALLFVRDRTLSTLPDQLANCQQLESLTINNQNLLEVPKCALALRGMVFLTLHDNQISELPEDIGVRLPNVGSVSIHGCPIAKLPTSLLDTMENLQTYLTSKAAKIVSSGCQLAWTTSDDHGVFDQLLSNEVSPGEVSSP